MEFKEGGLDHPDVIALLDRHIADSSDGIPAESSHALEIDAFDASDIRFWSLWHEDTLLGVGALKTLSTGAGEM